MGVCVETSSECVPVFTVGIFKEIGKTRIFEKIGKTAILEKLVPGWPDKRRVPHKCFQGFPYPVVTLESQN